MSGGDLTPSDLRQQHAESIGKFKTFEPQGVSRAQALEYLGTPDGSRYLQHLRTADATASEEEILRRALQQVRSGVDLPRLQTIDEPLVKLVARGQPLSPHSAFLTFEREIGRTFESGGTIADRFGLPIASEAPVYDAYVIRPKGSAEVFISRVAPTQELGGVVRRGGQAIQVLVPNRNQFHPGELIGTVENRLAPGQVYRPLLTPAGQSLEAAHLRPGLRSGGAALGIAGAALVLYDASETGFSIRRHLNQGNATAAQSEAIHFGSRTVGGFAGAGLGVAAGAMAGIETGPGALVTGAIGGIAGAVGGEKIAAWMDNRAIYNQTDRQGNTWTLDPGRPDRGWRRDAPVDTMKDGVNNAHREPLRASPLLENELNFQATAKSAELILGSPPVPRDPFVQPSNAHDAASLSPAPWIRDPESHQWQRTVTLAYVERGLSPTRVEAASPERAAELDRAAAQTIVENARNSAPVIAARFEEAYARNGWAAYGPQPEAVHKARTNVDSLVASDGNRYERQPDGRWVSEGLIYNSTANGNLREELDATRTVLAQRLPPPQAINPPAPLSAEDRLRDTVVGAYRNAGIELTPQQLDERAKAVGETWRERGLDPATTALRVAPIGNRVGLDSPIESLRLEADGKTYRIDARTVPEEAPARSTPAMPAGFAPVRPRPKDIRDEDHPGHAAYRQSLDHVHRMEARQGIASGEHSERLAATVAVAVERERFDVQRLEMGKDGQVIAIERGPGPRFPEKRLSIDTREALSQGIESTSQQWLSARSPHYGQPAIGRTPEQSRALARLSPQDQTMFARIRAELPASISDDVVGQVMLDAKREGIRDAASVDQALVRGDRVFVAGKIPGQLAMADVSGPTQPLAQNVEHIQSVNQHHQMADVQRTQEMQRA